MVAILTLVQEVAKDGVCQTLIAKIPIETDIEFQRAFSASFGTLPIERTGFARGPLVFKLTSSAFMSQKNYAPNN